MAQDCWFSPAGDLIMTSHKPKKQRKDFYGKPKHKRQKEMASHLDKKIAKELGVRAMPLRKGDDVKIMRGSFKGKSGKVSSVNLANMQVFIEKITRKRIDGTEIMVPFKSSNLLIVSLDRSDEKRMKRFKKAKKEPVEAKEGK